MHNFFVSLLYYLFHALIITVMFGAVSICLYGLIDLWKKLPGEIAVNYKNRYFIYGHCALATVLWILATGIVISMFGLIIFR